MNKSYAKFLPSVTDESIKVTLKMFLVDTHTPGDAPDAKEVVVVSGKDFSPLVTNVIVAKTGNILNFLEGIIHTKFGKDSLKAVLFEPNEVCNELYGVIDKSSYLSYLKTMCELRDYSVHTTTSLALRLSRLLDMHVSVYPVTAIKEHHNQISGNGHDPIYSKAIHKLHEWLVQENQKENGRISS